MGEIVISNSSELYQPICVACDERGEYTLATEEYFGEHYCSNCLQNRAEAAWERFCEDYYGGSGPVTISELTDRAYRERSDLRRRD